MTYRQGTIGEFMAWTKQVVRDPKAARGKPKRWIGMPSMPVSPEAMIKLLSPGNIDLLRMMARHKPKSVRRLAALTHRSEASVSRTLKKLQAADIVTLVPGEGRERRPVLTAQRVRLEIDLTQA
ncbi:MAG: MarR family transcriptional regulator [Alphaproteobacteria bacterium]|nr:MarR family transcriptional regulator [Alphaproteobacteria bacterium]